MYVKGEIGQQLVDRLTPEIINLRFNDTAPITVYIDSPGGSPTHARLIMSLLRTPTQDGASCRIITVVTGVAASAAADLLAAGDYVIAYPHATVHHHGTRTMSGAQPVTKEYASSLAEILKESNESFALALAERSLPRFFLRYMSLKSAFDAFREIVEDPHLTEVECLAQMLRIKMPAHKDVARQALEKHKRLNTLVSHYSDRLKRRRKAFKRKAEREAFLLQCIIENELQENPNEKWQFSTGGIAEIQEDFMLLSDYETGEHMRNLEVQVKRWGAFCLDEAQQRAYGALPTEEREKWLLENTREKFRSIWYFLVSACRALQQGENRLSAEDAYWIGLVDEVVGKPELTSLRQIMETPTKVETEAPAAETPVIKGEAPEALQEGAQQQGADQGIEPAAVAPPAPVAEPDAVAP